MFTKKVTPKYNESTYVDCFACKDIFTSFKMKLPPSLWIHACGMLKKKSQFAAPNLQREFLGSKYSSYESLYPLQNDCSEKISF